MFVGAADITQQKRMAEDLRDKLRAGESRYRALPEAIPDLIFHLDREGRFLDFMPAKGQAPAIPPTDFLGRTVHEVLPADLARRVMHHIEQALRTGETQAFEYQLPVPLPDGDLRHYEARIAVSGNDEVVVIAREITERRRAEGRLRLLSSAVEQSSEGMAVSDLAGNLLFVNNAFAAMHGYGPEELVGKHLSVFHTPEQTPAVDAANQQTRETGEFSGEIWHVQRDGTVFPTLMHNSLLRDEGGTPIGIVGTLRDITERKRAEETLRESEEDYRSLVEASPDAITLTDLDMNIVMCNEQAARLHGFQDAEELLSSGRNAFDLIAPEDRQRAIDNARKTLETSAVRNVEYTLVRKDSTSFAGELSASLIRDAEGKPKAFTAVTRDITERKRAEQALRQSEERFRRLAEDSIDGIVLVENSEVRFANPALVEMLGFESDEEIVGRPFTDFVLPEHGELMVERGRARDEGRDVAARYEFRALRKDGSEFAAEISVSTITYQGRRARQGVIRDITERKRAEEALRDSETRYRLLAENLTDVIWTADLKLNLTYVSPSMSRLTGYTAEESMRLTFPQVLTPASLEFIKKVYAEEMAVESLGQKDPYRSRTLELEVYRKDGSVIWVEANMAFLHDAAGRPAELLGVARDVTERKRAEVALRESEGRFRTLSEAALEGIVIHDGARVLEANQQVAAMLGCELSDIIGVDLPRFVAPESRDLVRQHIISGSEEPYEAVGLRMDGTPFPMELRAKSAFYQGRRVRVGAVRDLTDRKRAEEALQRARDELEARVERRIGAARRYDLTFRELTVLYLVAEGMADKEIAFRLGISSRTASKHVENILAKMGAISRTQAGVRAIQEGLVEDQG